MHYFPPKPSHTSYDHTHTKPSKPSTTKPAFFLENSNKENISYTSNTEKTRLKREEDKKIVNYESSSGLERKAHVSPLQPYNRNYNTGLSTHISNKFLLTSPKAREAASSKKNSEPTRILLKSLDNFLDERENKENRGGSQDKSFKPPAKKGKEENSYSSKAKEEQSRVRETNSRLLALAEDAAPEEMTIYTRLLSTTKPLTSKNKDLFIQNLNHNYYSPQHSLQRTSIDLVGLTNQARKAYLNGPTINGDKIGESENLAKSNQFTPSLQGSLREKINEQSNILKERNGRALQNERYKTQKEGSGTEKPKNRYASAKKLSIDIQEPIKTRESSLKSEKDMVYGSGYSKLKRDSSLRREADGKGLLGKGPIDAEKEGSLHRSSVRSSIEKTGLGLWTPKGEGYEANAIRKSLCSPKNFEKEADAYSSHSRTNTQSSSNGMLEDSDRERGYSNSKARERLMGSYSQKKRPLSLTQSLQGKEGFNFLKKKEEVRSPTISKQEKISGTSLKDLVTQVTTGAGIFSGSSLEGRQEALQIKYESYSTKNAVKPQVPVEEGYLSQRMNRAKPPRPPVEKKDIDLVWDRKVNAKKVEEIAGHQLKERSISEPVYYMGSVEKYLGGSESEDDYFCKIYKEHFFQSFQAINFCKYLKTVDAVELEKRKVYLPKRESHKDKKTLVFDLDETLIHCNENPTTPCDAVISIKFPHGDMIEAGINVRPYAVECLMELSKYYEIIVFTASHSCYANVALNYLDPEEKYIHHRLFRDHCITTPEGLYIKDLRIFANRDQKDIIIVDNAVYSFGYQLENGIPIIPFYFNKNDKELKLLTEYLKGLWRSSDVREVNKKTFKLHSYAEGECPEEILTKILAR